VDDASQGSKLKRLIAALEKHKGFSVGGETYKRVPVGYDPKHPRANLLRYSALYAIGPAIKPAVATSPKFLDECLAQCKVMFNLTRWLVEFKLKL
jgi:hypothetical protein